MTGKKNVVVYDPANPVDIEGWMKKNWDRQFKNEFSYLALVEPVVEQDIRIPEFGMTSDGRTIKIASRLYKTKDKENL